VTLFGDVAQQIYGRRLSWKDAGLKIESVWQFRKNYRNSREIAALGLAIAAMPYFGDEPDMVAPDEFRAGWPAPYARAVGRRRQRVGLRGSSGTRRSSRRSGGWDSASPRTSTSRGLSVRLGAVKRFIPKSSAVTAVAGRGRESSTARFTLRRGSSSTRSSFPSSPRPTTPIRRLWARGRGRALRRCTTNAVRTLNCPR
jgi:hypothetical protein